MTRVRNSPGVFLVTTRSNTSCTRSGRPRSRLSRMISSKNSRPRTSRSKICVRLTSICFEEQRAEVGIVNIEIVGIDVDRLVACKPELPVDLLALESLRLLLRHTHEHPSVADLTFPAEIVGNIILSFLVVELVEGNVFAFSHGLHGLAELLRYLPQHDRRRNRLAQLFPHEGDQPTRSRQRADVAVPVQPVQAFHFQGHVSVPQFRDARHAPILCPDRPCVLGVLASWRETIESRYDRERHRQRDRGRRLSSPYHPRTGFTGIGLPCCARLT